jgi:hypothetical protein
MMHRPSTANKDYGYMWWMNTTENGQGTTPGFTMRQLWGDYIIDR